MVEILSEVFKSFSGTNELAKRKAKKRGVKIKGNEDIFLMWKRNIKKDTTEIININDNNAALELIKNKDRAGKKERQPNKTL